MSDGIQRNGDEMREILADARAHLEWLRESGVVEVEGRATATAAAAAAATPTSTSTSSRDRDPLTPTLSPAGGEGGRPSTATANPSGAYRLTDNGCGSEALLAARREVGECSRCKLASGRTTIVFGVGDPRAELMFVGEGPGADEDLRGEPFVGKAGQLLTKMIEAMGYRREEVYIANVVKCRPPGNRDPEPDEIAACEPFLKAQIAAVGPKVVVALGRFAVQTLLRDPTPISRQRGRWRDYEGVKLMPTFHPAYLLRNPPEKKRAWEDLQLVMKELGKAPVAR